jgi:hypothetical protein
MSRSTALCSAALLALLSVTSLPVLAESKDRPANLQPLPAVPPPPPEMQAFDDNLDQPEVTIRKKESETQAEYRKNGKLYMIKVTPSVGAPYYLIDQNGDGKFVRTETLNPALTPPMWVIGTF